MKKKLKKKIVIPEVTTEPTTPLINLDHVTVGRDNIVHLSGVPPQEYARIAGELGVTQAALGNFFQIIEEKLVPSEKLDTALRNIAKNYKKLAEELQLLKSEDPIINELRMKAKAALDANDLDQAESLLFEARNKDIEAIKKQQEQLENRRLSAAQTHANLGALNMTRLAYTKAASYYHEAAELLPAGEMELRASYLHKWGYACWMDEDYDTAVEAYEEAYKARKMIHGPEHIDVATVLNHLALAYEAKKDFTKAESSFKQVVIILDKVIAADQRYSPYVLMSFKNLANLYEKVGKDELAINMYKQAREIVQKNADWKHPENAVILMSLANIFAQQEKYDAAANAYVEASEVWNASLGFRTPMYTNAILGYAETLRLEGKYDSAIERYERVLRILFHCLGTREGLGLHFYTDPWYTNTYFGEAHYESLIPIYERYLECLERADQPDLTNLNGFLNGLYTAAKQTNKIDKKTEIFSLAVDYLSFIKKTVRPNDLLLAYAWNLLGMIDDNLGAYELAEPYLKKGLEIIELHADTNPRDVADINLNLAQLYKKLNQIDRAVQAYHRAIEMKEKIFGPQHLEVALLLNELAVLFHNNKRFEEAEHLYKRAIDTLEQLSQRKDDSYEILLQQLNVLMKNYEALPKKEKDVKKRRT